MRLKAYLLCTLICIPFSVGAQQKDYYFQAFGVGHSSCATLTKDLPGDPYDFTGWISGFWSGSNWASESLNSHMGFTGRNTDVNGIMGEVVLYCQSHPSDTVFMAANAIFEDMRKKGK